MVLQKIKDRPRREVEGSPFEKAPHLEVMKIGVVKFYSCWSYLTGGQGRGKNEFVKSNFHQLDEPSVCISILQNTSTISEFISGKHLATVQNRQSGTFCKELAKTGKRSYDTGYSKRLRNPFYFAAKAIWYLCQLTKQESDLVDQQVQDMLRKGAIVLSDPKAD